jgi:hypothetical protein
MARLSVDAELARRQAQVEDRILEEQLMRRQAMLVNLLDSSAKAFGAERFADLPEDARANLLRSLYGQAEKAVFAMLAQQSTAEPGQELGPPDEL